MRFLISLLIGLVIGALAGIYIGWVQFPVEYVNSPASALASRYRDDFTVMVAEGYTTDRDIASAIERLRMLNAENIPEYVQTITERYISNSRDVDDTLALITLSDGLGRLTGLMQEYRQIIAPEGTTP
jgi:hypothetical protein